jgi:Holliday junction DNA helicase RuvA
LIAALRGIIERLEIGKVFLDSGGVIYEVQIPFKTYEELKSQIYSEVKIFIYHSITDRSQKLYGFSSYKDRELFSLFRSLNGIGDATALKVLSFLSANELYNIAVSEDKARLEKIPKIKGKTSEKILFELKQNLKKLESLLGEEKSDLIKYEITTNEYAIMALVQLGFDQKTAEKEVNKIASKMNVSDPAVIVKEVLRLTAS